MSRTGWACVVLVLAMTAPTPARADVSAETLALEVSPALSLDLVRVPAQTFHQGSPDGEPGRVDDERVREVTLTEAVYIGVTPVTRGAFAAFVAASGYRTEAEKGQSGGYGFDGHALVQSPKYTWRDPGFAQDASHPVVLTTFDDALAFTRWLAGKSGRDVGLPTEAEWEAACRSGTTTAYYGSEDEKGALARGWFKENAGDGTRPVKQKPPNAYGLYDMAGNVYEWTSDWYAPYPPSASGPATDPRAELPDTSDKARRVLRGGSWLRDAGHGRCAARARNTPGTRNADNGFRIAVHGSASAAGAGTTSTAPRDAVSGRGLSSAEPKAAPRDGAGLAPMVAWGSGGVAALLAVVGLVRWRGRGKKLRLRAAADGFWVHSPPRLDGATVHYRYNASTGTRAGTFVVETAPAGQFIYTGAPPRKLEVVRVMTSSGAYTTATGRGASRPDDPSRAANDGRAAGAIYGATHDDPPAEPAPFRGYPSAY